MYKIYHENSHRNINVKKVKKKMRLTETYYEKIFVNSNLLYKNYSYNKGLSKGKVSILNGIRNTLKIYDYFFSRVIVLASKPTITMTSEERVLTIFYYREDNSLEDTNINNLIEMLSGVLKRPVKLRFVKLNYPYLNSTILAKYLRLNMAKKNFRRLIKELLHMVQKIIIKNPNNYRSKNKKDRMPSHIIGMKIQIRGRLVTERVRPRKTVSTKQIGTIKSNNKTTFVDFGSYTGKNAHGAYTVKVWIAQHVV